MNFQRWQFIRGELDNEFSKENRLWQVVSAFVDRILLVPKNCPFCGVGMKSDAGHLGIEYTVHPDNDCFLSNMNFHIDRWNERV